MNYIFRLPITSNTKPMVSGDSQNKNKKKGLTYTLPTLETQAHKRHVAKDSV